MGFTHSHSEVVPASTARAYQVAAHQRFRIVAHEGAQVCDAAFVGADNHSVTYSSDLSVLFNQLEGQAISTASRRCILAHRTRSQWYV
ncbi:DUF1989 domain-containing protein [Natrialba swarupiae]|nr:DUF1989 domain-containing protein [Natrialba swarupiae]